MQQSTISLRRESTFSSSLVGFKVFIDDAPVGVIRSGKEKSFPVQPGQHSVQLRFLWCRSDPRTVEVAPRSHGHPDLQRATQPVRRNGGAVRVPAAGLRVEVTPAQN